jgi:hypothetical protein
VRRGSLQQLSDGRAGPRNDALWTELGEWRQDEPPGEQPGVREREDRSSKDQVLVQQQVEIQRPRAPANLTPPQRGPLDLEELSQKALGVEGGLELENRVQVARLPRTSQRLGVVHARSADPRDTRVITKLPRREGEMRPTVTEVASDADVGSHGAGSCRQTARYATGFLRMPIPETSTSTQSPRLMAPTPSGVPVDTTSPGSKVMT